MINNVARIGNFTSSEIYNLMSEGKKGEWGKPCYTYIEECNMERRLGRSLTDEVYARPLTWGKLLESRVFDLLGLQYTITSSHTIKHPTLPWAGSPDGRMNNAICDFKCPMTLKSFCSLVDPMSANPELAVAAIRDNHKDGNKYYWQLVSNACLTNSDYAELIVYMPYESELEEIKEIANTGQPEHYWIWQALENELPFLKDNGEYSNINILRFRVYDYDKEALHKRVKEASEKLIDWPKSSTITLHDPALPGTTIVDKI